MLRLRGSYHMNHILITSFQTLKREYNAFIVSHQTGLNFACPWDSEGSSRRHVMAHIGMCVQS